IQIPTKRSGPLQNVEGQLSKAKPVIRLLRFGHIPGMNNYSYLNSDFFYFHLYILFKPVRANVEIFSLHNYRSIFVKMA
ncbi:hypothetical protein HMPREF9493_02030, partial [Enterococcus faecalis DAPTO 516]